MREVEDPVAYMQAAEDRTRKAGKAIGASLLILVFAKLLEWWLPWSPTGLVSFGLLIAVSVYYKSQKAWFPSTLLWAIFAPFIAATGIFGGSFGGIDPRAIIEGLVVFLFKLICCEWPNLSLGYHFLVPLVSLAIWCIGYPIAYRIIVDDARRTVELEEGKKKVRPGTW